MTLLTEILIVLLVSTLLLVVILWKKLLTTPAALIAFSMGVLIGIFGGISWLMLLLILLFSSILATKYKFKVKKKMGLQEGRKGERGALSVLANGGTATLIAIMSSSYINVIDHTIGAIAYISAISVAGADTMASELGILSKNPRLITTWETVPAGTDGGVSTYGTSWALLGAAYISILGYLLLLHSTLNPIAMFIPLLIGFIGCNIDSVIGATIERGGHIGKNGNNFVSITMGAVLAWLIMML